MKKREADIVVGYDSNTIDTAKVVAHSTLPLDRHFPEHLQDNSFLSLQSLGVPSSARQAEDALSSLHKEASPPSDVHIIVYQPGKVHYADKQNNVQEADATIFHSVKDVLMKHVESFHTHEAVKDVLTSIGHANPSLKSVLEDAIRRQHTDRAIKEFDLSHTFERLQEVDPATQIMMQLNLSNANAGKLLAARHDGVKVAYDGNLGILTLTGALEDVQAMVREIHFHADVTQLKHFWIDIKILPVNKIADADAALAVSFETLSTRMVVLYEKASGFHVVQFAQNAMTTGRAVTMEPSIHIVTPVGTSFDLPYLNLSASPIGTQILFPDKQLNEAILSAEEIIDLGILSVYEEETEEPGLSPVVQGETNDNPITIPDEPDTTNDNTVAEETDASTDETQEEPIQEETDEAETDADDGSDTPPPVGLPPLSPPIAPEPVINTAPENAVPVGQGLFEDGTLTLSVGNGNAVSIGDVDNDNPMRVTLSVSDGVLSLSTVLGLTFIAGADNSSSMTIEGTQAAINGALDGLVYTPTGDYAGPDTLTVVSDDLQGGTDTDTVVLTVSGVNDAPVAVGDNYTVAEDGNLVVNAATGVLSNDDDAQDTPSDALAATLVTDVSHGALTLNADGSFTYTPDSDFTGTDSFTYEVSDDGGTANGGDDTGNTVTVTLDVAAANDAPTFSDLATTLVINETDAQTGNQLIDGDVTVGDIDSVNFDSGQLSVDYDGAAIATDQISILNVGTNPGEVGFNGSVVTYSGVGVATVSGGNNGVNGSGLLLDIGNGLTPAMLEAIIEHLTFATTSQIHDSNRTIDISFTDGDGGSSPTQSIDIQVSDIGENDVFTPGNDTLLGGVADDTISGDADDWGSADEINLGAGANVINLTDAGSASVGASVTGALTVNLTDNGSYQFTIGNAAATSIAIAAGVLTGLNALTVNATTYTHDMDIFGGDGDDAVTVGSGNYAIQLGGGADSIIAANATMDNGITIDGGAGTDVLVITNNATLTYADLSNVSGVDRLELTSNIARLEVNDALVNGTDHGDIFIVDNATYTLSNLRTDALTGANEVVIAGTGQVQLANNDNNHVRVMDGVNGDVLGSNGRDFIDGGSGNDSINGLAQNDSIQGFSGEDILLGGNNNDTIYGGDDNDTINGENNNDRLYGDAGDDQIDGGNQNDSLTGGAGADQLTGGAGVDRYIYLATSDSTQALRDTILDFDVVNETIDLTALGALNYLDNEVFTSTGVGELRWELSGADGLFQVDEDGNGSVDMEVFINGIGTTGLNFSNFVGNLTDVSAPTLLVFTSTAGDSLIGEEGSTGFETSDANFQPADTADGGIGEDTITFTDTANIVLADWVNKSDIETIVLNGTGNDIEVADTYVQSVFAQDLIINQQGNTLILDTSDLAGGSRVVIAGTGAVTLRDGVDNTRINIANGVSGNVTGGTGNDSVSAGTSNTSDMLSGGAGNDWLRGFSGQDILNGDGGSDTLIGDRQNDTLNGGDGDDSLNGGRQNDLLDGGDGNDTLFGERETDTMTGGLGDDIFRFSANNHSGNGAARDVITDFGIGNDVIDLSGFAGTFSVVSSGAGAGEADFNGVANEVAWFYDGSDMIVYLDTNGNGTSNLQIELTGVTTLSGADFIP